MGNVKNKSGRTRSHSLNKGGRTRSHSLNNKTCQRLRESNFKENLKTPEEEKSILESKIKGLRVSRDNKIKLYKEESRSYLEKSISYLKVMKKFRDKKFSIEQRLVKDKELLEEFTNKFNSNEVQVQKIPEKEECLSELSRKSKSLREATSLSPSDLKAKNIILLDRIYENQKDWKSQNSYELNKHIIKYFNKYLWDLKKVEKNIVSTKKDLSLLNTYKKENEELNLKISKLKDKIHSNERLINNTPVQKENFAQSYDARLKDLNIKIVSADKKIKTLSAALSNVNKKIRLEAKAKAEAEEKIKNEVRALNRTERKVKVQKSAKPLNIVKLDNTKFEVLDSEKVETKLSGPERITQLLNQNNDLLDNTEVISLEEEMKKTEKVDNSFVARLKRGLQALSKRAL